MKNIKRIVALTLAMALLACACLAFTSCDNKKYTIGICQLVTHDSLDLATQGFKDALTEALEAEGRTVVYKDQNGQDRTKKAIGSYALNN